MMLPYEEPFPVIRMKILSVAHIFTRILGAIRAPAPRLAILDDLYPYPVSGFRGEEFLSYLEEMPGVSIYTNGEALPLVQETRTIQEVIADHLASNPRHSTHIFVLSPGVFPEADAYYSIFLNNITKYLEDIERSGKPFAFTLYPGGGFQTDDEISDDKLHRVCNSPCFRRVIVTQPNILDYLLNRDVVPESHICYIQGGILPRAAFDAPEHGPRFGIDKAILDIGFVTNRYTPTGQDKGYDLFVETAATLYKNGVTATYHVVGPWDTSILPLREISPHFVFYGYLSTVKLRELGRRLDLILSPNRPGVLASGAFDGFPTASCAEIGLQEAAIVCTDILKLNTEFRNGVDILLVEPNVEDIVQRLMAVIEKPPALAQIGKNGRSRLYQIAGRERQLPPRLSVLRAITKGV